MKQKRLFLWICLTFLISVTTLSLYCTKVQASGHYFKQLNTNEKKAYKQAVKGLNADGNVLQVKIAIEGKIGETYNSSQKLEGDVKDWLENSAERIKYAIYDEHPEIFWIKNITYDWKYNIQGDKFVVAECNMVIHCFKTSETQKKNYNKAVNKAVKKIKKIRKKKSKKSTIIAINKYICKRVKFKESKRCRTSYGALMDKKAVCEGYSKLYLILARKFKIKSTLGVGTVNDVGHMWNYSYLKKKWLLMDITFNDQEKTEKYLFLKKVSDRTYHKSSFRP